jgi:hypothetical protein
MDQLRYRVITLVHYINSIAPFHAQQERLIGVKQRYHRQNVRYRLIRRMNRVLSGLRLLPALDLLSKLPFREFSHLVRDAPAYREAYHLRAVQVAGPRV